LFFPTSGSHDGDARCPARHAGLPSQFIGVAPPKEHSTVYIDDSTCEAVRHPLDCCDDCNMVVLQTIFATHAGEGGLGLEVKGEGATARDEAKIDKAVDDWYAWGGGGF